MRMNVNVKRVLAMLLAGVTVFPAFAIAGCASTDVGTATQGVQSSSGSSGATASAGTQASSQPKEVDFTLTGLDGNTYTLSDFVGKPVLLNFWATWCPPCKGEMPLLEQTYNEWKDKGVVILAVDIGESASTVQKFIDQNGYTFNILLDQQQKVANTYLVQAIPTTYFIDKNGIIQGKQVGAFPDIDHIEAYLNKLTQ